jgi:hypothetical protein
MHHFEEGPNNPGRFLKSFSADLLRQLTQASVTMSGPFRVDPEIYRKFAVTVLTFN